VKKHRAPNNFMADRLPAAILATVLLTSAKLSAAGVEATPHDKSSYTLFNPTPTEYMRELNTDRPDKTESPYTVDAGHYQIESDLFTYTHDHITGGGADTSINAWSFGTLNLKAGLCNSTDFQLILNPYNRITTDDHSAKTVTHQSGFGDAMVRVKWNAWGNDGGKTAGGIMPFLKLPTNQDGLGNHAIEGGLIFPLAVELPAGWGLGAMTEFDWNQNDGGGGYHTVFVNSVTLDHNLIGKLDGYVEFFTAASTERHSTWQGTFDLGLEYKLTDNIQLDTGVNIGVTDSADDVNPFVGISIRF